LSRSHFIIIIFPRNLGAKPAVDGEIALAHVPPDVRGCVRTSGNLVYVLEENFVIYMLATSEADLAPFRLVLAAKKSNLPREPKPSPSTAVSRITSGVSQDSLGYQQGAINTSQESDYDQMSATPTKRIKLSDVVEQVAPVPAGIQEPPDTQMMVDMIPEPPKVTQDVKMQMEEQQPSDDPESPEAQLAAILPQIPLIVIRRALADLGNNVQEATEALLLNPDKYMQPDDVIGDGDAPSASSNPVAVVSSVSSSSAVGSPARPKLPPPSPSAAAKPIVIAEPVGANDQVDDDDDGIEVRDEEFDMAMAQSLQESQQAIDDIKRRLEDEEKDRLLAQQIFEDEERKIKQIEEEKKRAADFDSSVEEMRLEVARQHQEAQARFEQERQELLRQLEEAKVQKAQVEARSSGGVGAVVKKDVEFPSSWDKSVCDQFTHATVEISPLSQEFQNIAISFLQSCGGRTYLVSSFSVRSPDSALPFRRASCRSIYQEKPEHEIVGLVLLEEGGNFD
jgi:hypothetical protein